MIKVLFRALKGFKFHLKYIKSTNKKDYNLEDIESVQQYFEVSKKEAKEYIDMLPKDELETIKQQINGVYN